MASIVDGNQRDFRARNDDGNETTATWKASLNTNWSQAQNVNFRLRYAIPIAILGSTWDSASNLKFQYNRNSTGWNDITNASSVVRLSTSVNVTDETATTQQISSPDTFAAGNILTSSTTTTNTVGNAAVTIESEFCAQILSVDTNNGDTIQIRVINSANVVATSTTNTAIITVIGPITSAIQKASSTAMFFV